MVHGLLVEVLRSERKFRETTPFLSLTHSDFIVISLFNSFLEQFSQMLSGVKHSTPSSWMQAHSGRETKTPTQKYEQKRSPEDLSPLSSPSQIQTWALCRSWEVSRKPEGQHWVPGTPYPNPVKSILGVCHKPATSGEPWDAWPSGELGAHRGTWSPWGHVQTRTGFSAKTSPHF